MNKGRYLKNVKVKNSQYITERSTEAGESYSEKTLEHCYSKWGVRISGFDIMIEHMYKSLKSTKSSHNFCIMCN